MTCFLLTIWYSLKAYGWVSGHEYVEVLEDVLKCKKCGHISVGWKRV